jgi:hypothetical protein
MHSFSRQFLYQVDDSFVFANSTSSARLLIKPKYRNCCQQKEREREERALVTNKNQKHQNKSVILIIHILLSSLLIQQ